MLKGILLAGGANTRLYPLTLSVCKQLLPVYDKPMIFYPLSTLLTCGCQDIMVITRNERDQSSIMEMLPPALFGVKMRYVIQPKPLGLPDAFRIAKRHDFLGPQDYVVMALGDNLLHGAGLDTYLPLSANPRSGAKAFFHQVKDPQRYGVGCFEGKELVDIVEKPDNPPSDWAQIGLYAYDYSVVQIAEDLQPSARGELEIVDVNKTYLQMGALEAYKLPPGTCWFDMGTPDALLEAGEYVATIQKRQGILVGCPALAALRSGLTDERRVAVWADQFDNEYGRSLRRHLQNQ